MTKSLLVPMIFLAASAQAGEYWHPEAEKVIFAGPDGATVCQWLDIELGVGPNPGDGEWTCEDIDTYGAKWPIEIELESAGPVKVVGARWAYAWDGLSWVLMAKD